MSCDYDIFGLDKESSTLNDAKKAYYNLALLVHPDRNACINKDTAKLEMKVLTNMYKNIKKELESRDLNNKYKECDDLVNIREKEVEEIDKFNNDMPSFMDIYLETHEDMKKFHKSFENNVNKTQDDYLLNSCEGYKTIKSEYEGKSFDNLSYNPKIVNDPLFVHFKKPNSEIISIDKLGTTNYSNGFDYMEAHGCPDLLEDRIPKESIQKYNELEDLEHAFEKKLKEMEIIP